MVDEVDIYSLALLRKSVALCQELMQCLEPLLLPSPKARSLLSDPQFPNPVPWNTGTP